MVIRYVPVQSNRQRIARGPLLAPGTDRLPLSIRVAGLGGRVSTALRRARLAVIMVMLLPFAAAGVVQSLRPTSYRAGATVFVDPQVSGSRTSADAGVLAAQMRLAQSRTVLANAIAREKLNDDSSFVTQPSGMLALLRRVAGLAGVERLVPGEDRATAVMRVVSGAIAVRSGDGANLVEISASLGSAAVAMRMANAVAQSFVEEIVASADTANGSERARASRRIEDVKTRLGEAEAKLATYRARHGLDDSGRAAAPQESDLVMQLARVRLASAEARTRYDQLQKVMAGGKDPEAVADLVKSASVERLKAQYGEAAAQETNLRTTLGPRHPAYLEALQNAREKRRLLQEGLRLALSAARIEWQAARDQEIALEKRAAAEQPQPAALPQPAPTQLRDLEREVDIARAAYERSMRTLEGREEPGTQVAARIVAAATMPLSPSSDGRSRLWGGALLASVLLGMFVACTAVLRGLLRKSDPAPTVRRPASSAPLVVTTDSMPGEEPVAGALPRRVFVRQPSAHEPPVPATPLTDTVEQLALELEGRMEEFPLQSVYVAGTDGARTGAALALARAAQGLQMRVLLIDADQAEAPLTVLYGAGAALGTVSMQGRERPLVLVEGSGSQRICLIPGDGRNRTGGLRHGRSLGSLTGNFDVVIVLGPGLEGSVPERRLAHAAQMIVLARTGEAPADIRDAARKLSVDPGMLRCVASAPVEPDMSQQAPKGIIRLRRVA